MERNYSISGIRFIAMLLIIITHILGFYENPLTYWVNIGVQIFFFISGLLYGARTISGSKFKWIKKRAVKLLKSFYVYIIIVFVVYYFLFPEYLEIKKVIGYFLCIQAFLGSIEGIEQLWFVTYILICYILTPIFFAPVMEKVKNLRAIKFWIVIIGISLIVQVITIPLAVMMHFKAAWIIIYWIGYAVSVRYNILEDKHIQSKEENNLFKIVVVCLICSILIRIVIDIIGLQENTGMIRNIVDFVVQYLKVVMGIGLTWVLYKLFSRISKPNKKIKKILDFSDKYSYEVYLVHQMFVLSDMAVLSSTGKLHVILSIIVAFICIFITAIILHTVSNKLVKVSEVYEK